MFLMRKEIDELDERVYLDGQKAEVWRAGRVVESWPCSRPVGYLLLSVVLGRAREQRTVFTCHVFPVGRC